MRYIKNLFLFIVALAMLTFLLLGAWKFWLIFRSLDSNVAAAIVAAIASVIGLALTQNSAKKREIAEGHRSKKIEVYNIFLDIVERFMNAEKSGETLDKIKGSEPTLK